MFTIRACHYPKETSQSNRNSQQQQKTALIQSYKCELWFVLVLLFFFYMFRYINVAVNTEKDFVTFDFVDFALPGYTCRSSPGRTSFYRVAKEQLMNIHEERATWLACEF